jgi:hypothetical protein
LHTAAVHEGAHRAAAQDHVLEDRLSIEHLETAAGIACLEREPSELDPPRHDDAVLPFRRDDTGRVGPCPLHAKSREPSQAAGVEPWAEPDDVARPGAPERVTEGRAGGHIEGGREGKGEEGGDRCHVALLGRA